MVKNIGNIKNPVHYVSWNPIFLQNVKYVGAIDTEFHFFNWIPKKKEKNVAILWLLRLWILHTYYITLHQNFDMG